MGRLLLGLYRLLKKRRWLLFMLIAVWAALVTVSISRISFSEDITHMLPDDQRAAGVLKTLDASVFSDRLVLHLIADSLSDADGLLAAGDFLVEELGKLSPELITDDALKIDEGDAGLLYDMVMANLPYLLNESDFQYLDSLIYPEFIEQKALSNYRGIVSPTGVLTAKYIVRDPLGLGARVMRRLSKFNLDDELQLVDGFLMSPDERHIVLFARPSFPANDARFNEALADSLSIVEQKLADFSENRIVLEAFGAPLAAHANATRIKQDIRLTVSLAAAALLLVIFLFYRSIRVFVFILVPSIIGGATALAIFGLSGIPVSLISIGIGSVLLGISIDYALHVFTHFRASGNVESTIKDLSEPVLLSSLTTAAAFFTLLLLNAPAMRHLGVFAGVSVLVGAFSALWLLPHVLSPQMALAEEKRKSFIDRFNGLRPDKNKYLVVAVLGMSVLFFVFKGDVGFEGDLLKMNYASPELIRAEKNLEKISNAALKNVLFVSEGATWDEALVSAENLARFVESENEAGRSNESASVVHILPSQDLAQERLEKWQRWIGEGKFNEIEKRLHNASVQLGMKAGAYAAFFNQVAQPFGALDYGQWAKLPLFNNFIHSDEETVQLVTVVKTAQKYRAQLTAGVSEMEGIAILDKQHLTNKVITFLSQDFDQLVKWSLLVVFLILLIIYGRIEIAIFTFIPMLLAWLWTLGLMQIFDLQFNIFNIIISTFIFGLGIDYSIFITRSFMQQFKFGRDELVAYKNSIFLSAFTTTVGVGVLIFAGHPALKSIAAMSLVGIISMVLMAYTVQPLLLRWAMTDRKNRGLVPVNAVNLFLGLFSLTYFFVGCLVLNVAIVLLQLLPFSGDRKRMLFRGLMSVFLGSLAALMANVRRQYLNPHGETFAKPAVVIANHQSFIDILITLNIHPKMVMVVKKWVYDSPVFGWAVRYAGYFHVNDGYEKFIPRLRELVKQGCSIVVFPEGTRSEDGQLNRFHKGAFYLSEQLELDIVPVIFHGNAYSMPKGDSYLLKNGFIHRVIEPRILYHDRSWGNTYQERTKRISAHFKSRFAELKKEFETPDYFRDQLIRNYILKGPMLEWYTRIKTRMEGNYRFFHEHLPTEGTIVDIGCGYGYLAHILAWTSNKREVIGFDHDEEKVAVAANTPLRTPNLRFEKHNLLTDSVPPADAYVLADVLHYLPEPDQQRVIKQCIAQLNRGGVLLIRDADAELRERQKGTWLTEFISTNLGFNKMNSNKLCFVSRAFVEKTVHDSGASFTVFDRSRFTSNVVYLIRKPVG